MVTPAPPVVAAFDFDGTLTRGGSVWPFLVTLRGRRRVAVAALVLAGRLAAAALFGGRFADQAKEALFRRTLAGILARDLVPGAVSFGLDHYRDRARADVRRRLEWHRAQGHHLVIVSASLQAYLDPVGEMLGVDTVVATRLAVGPDGRLTGAYEGRNCRGEEKLARIRLWMEDTFGARAADAVLWAYGNSEGDRRLLRGADHGVDVGRLGRFGALRAFPRLADLSSGPGAGNPGAGGPGAGDAAGGGGASAGY